MISGTMLERYKAEAMLEFKGDDDAALDHLWNRVSAVFDQWKQEHGNRKPKEFRGLFDFASVRTIPFKKAAPWQCADFQGHAGPITLAVKLLRDEYAPFWAIATEVGVRKVLALLIVRFGGETSDEDVDDAMSMLRAHATSERAVNQIVPALLDRHRIAIEAQRTRSSGGNDRAEQLRKEKDDKHRKIREAEEKLPETVKPRHVNKTIAKSTGLETDYVRKARKAMKGKTSGS